MQRIEEQFERVEFILWFGRRRVKDNEHGILISQGWAALLWAHALTFHIRCTSHPSWIHYVIDRVNESAQYTQYNKVQWRFIRLGLRYWQWLIDDYRFVEGYFSTRKFWLWQILWLRTLLAINVQYCDNTVSGRCCKKYARVALVILGCNCRNTRKDRTKQPQSRAHTDSASVMKLKIHFWTHFPVVDSIYISLRHVPHTY